MGAHFVCCIIRVVPDLKNKFTEAVLSLTDDDLDDILNWGLAQPDLWGEESAKSWREQCVEYWEYHLETFEVNREVCRIHLDGVDYWGTGGMTWGDTPSGMWDLFLLIEYLQDRDLLSGDDQ